MSGSLLDIVLVVAAVLFAVSGYRQGVVVGLLSFVGFLGGGVLGARFAPDVADGPLAALPRPAAALFIVVLAASLGQLLAATLGRVIRRRLTWHPARVLDALAGGALSGTAVLLVAWLVATALAGSPYPGAAAAVRSSAVLGFIDHLVPSTAQRQFAQFRALVDRGGFPEVFDGLDPTRAREVPPPNPALAGSKAVAVARTEVFKITGVAKSCDRRIEGSGFVYAPERVMTNAHVVAGVTSPQVQVGNRSITATVVLYDPGRDVAVLRVPGLNRPALTFAGPASDGADAVVVGYPEDGPFTAVAARVRRTQSARGPDIYQQRTVTREVYELRATVRPGNSGGPLFAPDGRVYGVVFAAAADDPDTGYALTAGEVASDASAGATRTQAVSTQSCD